ncbi:MAG: type II toxin-antitoxin system RelE/ParE family toxin [Synergistaceae bacterium]|nr:type II toxin-antitoxin system RelE/ParE family toxin [Synergistaceae bacterium]
MRWRIELGDSARNALKKLDKPVGSYRLICEIRDEVLVVLVLEIGHRSNIYK